MDEIAISDDKLYAFQYKKKDEKMEQSLLEYNNGKFIKMGNSELETAKDQVLINQSEKYITSNLEKKAKFKTEKNKLIYDEKKIRGLYLDELSNLYVLGFDRHVRKYDRQEIQIMDLNTKTGTMTNSVVISKKGNIYILKLFSEKYPDKEGRLSIDDYSGIEIVKWVPYEK